MTCAPKLSSPRGQAEVAIVRELVGELRLILRVDRLEPAKNIVRGIAGFEAFLAANPSARGTAPGLRARLFSSRVDTPEYQRYAAEVRHAVGAVNERFRTDTWEPIVLDTHNNFECGLALMAQADVIVINPLRDGMNLVAKEAAAVSDNNVVGNPVLTRWRRGRPGGGCDCHHRFDTEELAGAIAAGLAMAAGERSYRLTICGRPLGRSAA